MFSSRQNGYNLLLFELYMEHIAAINNLTFKYHSYTSKQSANIFSDTSFLLEKGVIQILYGRPESGKTTLCRLLAGLIPMYQGGTLSGDITLGEIQIREQHAFQLLSKIGIVFQDPEEQLFMPVCEDEILFPLEHLELSHEEIGSRLEQVIDFYDLQQYRTSNPANLSGGEKKRLLMAVLDAVDPELWVLDETFEELDINWREKILRSLKERGKSVLILASKDIDLYETYGDRFGVIIKRDSGNHIEFSGREHAIEVLGDTLPSIELSEVLYAHERALCNMTGLQFTYKHSNHDFLISIDALTLYDQEVLALYGPNGSGKSTLCKILCGLISPNEGKISIRDGEKMRVASENDLLRHTGYLFQNPDFQIFLPTIGDELKLGLTRMGIQSSEADQRIREATDLFDLGDVEQPPAIMSYGKRKRLQAAVYYLLERKVCILDETDSGISLDDYAKILELLKGRVDAVILITHDMRLAEACSHRIIEMKDGEIQKERRLCR